MFYSFKNLVFSLWHLTSPLELLERLIEDDEADSNDDDSEDEEADEADENESEDEEDSGLTKQEVVPILLCYAVTQAFTSPQKELQKIANDAKLARQIREDRVCRIPSSMQLFR